jgi:cation diffusion facilitator CzcD-associated flavoprotein CzcO
MNPDDTTVATLAQEWLSDFEQALTSGDPSTVTALISHDGYWRDLLALSWGIHTYYGRDQIASMLAQVMGGAQVWSFELHATHPPRLAERAGMDVIELAFTFETIVGSARGVAALCPPEAGRHEAWTVLTELDDIRDPAPASAPSPAVTYMRDFAQPNWLERRTAEQSYSDRDPAVVVIGAGQAGLAIAARLRRAGVDALVVERGDRVGDNWRKRYRSLVLHNEVWANHLPYLPFPATWPTYIPKDLLADWLESYAEFMELNVWTSTEFAGGEYDRAAGRWTVRLRRGDGSERVLRPRHVVMAPGVSSIPHVPAVSGLDGSGLDVIHSSNYRDASEFTGRRVVVIGTGTSGHDIAQDLQAHGVDVAIVQRSSSSVVNVGPDRAGKIYDLYSHDLALDVADLLNVSVPYPLLRQHYQLVTRHLAELDAELLAGLQRVGFRYDFGPDNTGFQMKYLRKGGGYYINVGCSDLIVSGAVKLLQFDDIAGFGPEGVHLRAGRVHGADLVILATGFYGQEEVVRRLFGETVAERVGPIWGYDEEGELRSMWCRTGQPGLWFTAGSLAQCRIYSKYLALQIKACESGLLSPERTPGEEPAGCIREIDSADLWDGQLAALAGDQPVDATAALAAAGEAQ